MAEAQCYLKQVDTGRIYPWTKGLALRADMVEHTEPVFSAPRPTSEPIEDQTNIAELLEKIAKLEAENTDLWERIGAYEADTDIPDIEMSAEEREAKVREAIRKIEPENYAKARLGFPPLPKVNDVSEKVGFRVTFDEIKKIMVGA